MTAPKALRPTDLTWTRDGRAWVAHTPEGHYQIRGRSGGYVVWFIGDNRRLAQPDTALASAIYYLDDAKQTAIEDHAIRTATARYASDAFKRLVGAQQQVRLAMAAARRDGLEEAEGILMAAYDQIDVTRDAVLRAGKVSQRDPREQAEDVKLRDRV